MLSPKSDTSDQNEKWVVGNQINKARWRTQNRETRVIYQSCLALHIQVISVSTPELSSSTIMSLNTTFLVTGGNRGIHSKFILNLKIAKLYLQVLVKVLLSSISPGLLTQSLQLCETQTIRHPRLSLTYPRAKEAPSSSSRLTVSQRLILQLQLKNWSLPMTSQL